MYGVLVPAWLPPEPPEGWLQDRAADRSAPVIAPMTAAKLRIIPVEELLLHRAADPVNGTGAGSGPGNGQPLSNDLEKLVAGPNG
jgi:hypothetical protein